MKLLPEVSTLPSLVAISLVKMKIYIFQIVTGTHVGHMIKGPCGSKGGDLS